MASTMVAQGKTASLSQFAGLRKSGEASQGVVRAARPARAASVKVVRAAANDDSVSVDRRSALTGAAALTIGSTLDFSMLTPSAEAAAMSSDWVQVNTGLPEAVVILDIGFTGTDPNHGFLLGTRQTLLETFDGGKTWAPRSVESAQDEGFNYRFQSIDFNGDEGWIIGKPAILLHTTDGGKNWNRVPLSAKLPGDPLLIKALDGEGQAEMATSAGALYVTNNAAYTWQAAVQETVDATLNRTVSSGISGASFYEGSFSNIARADDGSYVAVSSRGNFFMTWAPGESYWSPHNRPSARRLQNMGYDKNNKIWLTTRGGDLYTGDVTPTGDAFEPAKIASRGFGVLDVEFQNKDVGFACGGSGSLFKSTDGGASWKRDRSTDNIAGNLYDIKFFNNGKLGFILGNGGVVLRYIGASK